MTRARDGSRSGRPSSRSSRALLLVATCLLGSACGRLPSRIPLADSARLDLDDPAALVDRTPHSASETEGEGDVATDSFEIVAESPKGPSVPSAAKAAPAPAGSVGSARPSEASWPGDYYGSDRFVWRGEDGRETVEVDDRAHTRVEDGEAGSIVISIVNSVTGEVICPLEATVSGNQATVREGETCFGGPDQEATVKDGRATLDGDRLTLDFAGSLVAEDGGGGREEGSYHFDGRRR